MSSCLNCFYNLYAPPLQKTNKQKTNNKNKKPYPPPQKKAKKTCSVPFSRVTYSAVSYTSSCLKYRNLEEFKFFNFRNV